MHHIHLLFDNHGPDGEAVWDAGGLPGQRGVLPRGCLRHVPLPQCHCCYHLSCSDGLHLLCTPDPAIHTGITVSSRKTGRDLLQRAMCQVAVRTAWPASFATCSWYSQFSPRKRNTCLCVKVLHMYLFSAGCVFSEDSSEMGELREFSISFLRHPLLTTSIMQF